MNIKGFISRTGIGLLIFAVSSSAGVIELRKTDGAQIYAAGFKLDSDKTLKIHVIGAGGKKELKKVSSLHHGDTFNLFTYAWILDAETREMVWRMRLKDSRSDWWNKWNVEYEGEIDLPGGEYELYFSMVKPTVFALQDGYMSLGKMFEKIFGDDTWWEDHSDDWFCRLENVDIVLGQSAVEKYQEALKSMSIINLTDLGDSAYESRGFSITKPLEVEIYAIGEGFKGEMYDFGWILDANSRERIWEMDERHSEYAGGGVKNRMFKETLTLDPGDYLVYYKTDDNHSDEAWNTNPPYDPNFWGITIFPAERDFDQTSIKKFLPQIREKAAVVDLTHMGDNEYEKQGFVITKKGKFRIYALGEGRDGHMYDYGWITNAQTGRVIWKMRYRDTRHAGGADKNREIDDVIVLDAGKYIAHYQTDGSHSYEEWNERRPREPELWGISIFPLDDESEIVVADHEDLEGRHILADLTRIGNDEYVKKQFTLDRQSRVRVYCIGEGDWDEMYDYGWIKNAETGQIVWKMRYRKTDKAGGAEKNRKEDIILNLDPGIYWVYYKTDDSHSYDDWNATPPEESANWGITVYLLDQ